ncbi:MAG: HAD family phosphatase [Bdellovibrionota bacterium]
MIKTYFPNREFKAYLFDFDGTVADTMPVHHVAWNEALSLYNLTLTLEQHHGWAGRPTREIIELLNQTHNITLPVDDILKFKEQHYLNSIPSVKAIVPVVEIIKAAHGKVPMAIVSGSRRKPVETTLKQIGMSHFFDLLVCAEDYTHGKPAPDCFLKAAKLLGVPPDDCLVFEDAVLGIEAAHAAGMMCLRVDTHPEDGHRLSISELKTKLEN